MRCSTKQAQTIHSVARLVAVLSCVREFAGSISGFGAFFHQLSATGERMNTEYRLTA